MFIYLYYVVQSSSAQIKDLMGPGGENI